MTTQLQPDDARLAAVDAYVRRVRGQQDQLIETLHVAQDIFGCLDVGVLMHVARALRLPPSLVYGVATFYHLFTFEPPGEHVCTVCTGTACFVKGADDIVGRLASRFEVPVGQTSADRRFTLRTARCLGSCGLAPVCVVDGAVLGHQNPAMALAAVEAAVGPIPDPAGSVSVVGGGT